MKKNNFLITKKEKEVVISILKKVSKKNIISLNLINFTFLSKILNKEEKNFLKKIRRINPRQYGFKGKYLGIQRIPKNLTIIKNQKYKYNGKQKNINKKYIPNEVFLFYKKMNKSMYKDINKKLLVSGCYRSPACQLFLFLYYLNKNNFNFKKTMKRVAFPGYSEHGYPTKQAIDFMTIDGVPDTDDKLKFEKTIEYKWLLKNASNFNFFLSYPKNNKLGIMFEPWHWHFNKNKIL